MNALAPSLRPNLSATDIVHALRTDGAVHKPPLRAADEERSRAARAPHWSLIALAAAAGIAASLVLVPHTGLTDRPAADQALARLEAAVANGDRAPDTVIALARERHHAGNPQAGLVLLQDMVSNEPRQPQGWQALADMLYEQGRSAEALVALERAQRLAPTPEREALLVSRRQHARRSEGNGSATVTAAVPTEIREAERLLEAGAWREALTVLEAFGKTQPGQVDSGVVNLQMRALLAMTPGEAVAAVRLSTVNSAASARATNGVAANADAALARAQAWLQQRPSGAGGEALRLSATLTHAGYPAHGARLVEPWLGQGPDGLVTTWAQAMRAAGQGDAAMARLARMNVGPTQTEVLRQRVVLAIGAGKAERAWDIVRTHGVDKTPPDVLATLVDALISDPTRLQARAVALRDIWLRGGTALRSHDVLAAARAAWASGDSPAATELAQSAIAWCQGKADCPVRLASLNHLLGHAPETVAALTMIEGPIDESLLPDYARLAVMHGMAADALTRLERQRRPVPNPSFDAAWALVGTAAGRQAEVLRWVEASQPEDVAPGLMRELFEAATRAAAHPLAVATGLRMDARDMRPANRVLLAQSMMDSGRTVEALAQWRQVRASSRSYDDAYVQALRMALSRGVGTEARAEFAQSQLAAIKALPADERRDPLIQTLLDLAAYDDALPALEAQALAHPGRALGQLEEVARKAGRIYRLAAVWRRVAGHPTMSTAQQLHVAESLTRAGLPQAAEPALRMAAVDALPEDPVVQQMLALWGPKLALDQIDWLEARAFRASRSNGDESGVRRAAWMNELTQRGAAARTVALYKRLQPRPDAGPVYDAYMQALGESGGPASLASSLGATKAKGVTGMKEAKRGTP